MQLMHLKRDNDIIEEYRKLAAIKTPKGNVKFSNGYIVETISEKFFLPEFTINEIINKNKQNDKQTLTKNLCKFPFK